MTFLLVMATALTSLLAVFAGVRYLGLNSRNLPEVAGMALECIGIAVAFAILNIGVASAVVVVTRTLGVGFVSAYVAGDVVWLVISMLQAVFFQLWRATRAAS